MKASFSRIFCGITYRSGLLHLGAHLAEPRDRPLKGGCFQILVYHRVGSGGEAFFPAASVKVFERQARYLCRHFNLFPLTDLVRAAERREIPPRAIAITFDDGYEDLHTHVLPIARRERIPITVYLATGFIDGDQPMWNDALAGAFRDTTEEVLSDVPGCPVLPLRSVPEREQALARTLTALKYRPPVERAELVERIRRALKADAYAGPRMLRWYQVREMYAAGVKFGAHTVSHPILTQIPPDKQYEEILASKRAIEERLGAPVLHFAYPNGSERDFDDVTKALVQQAGFVSASSTIFGTNTADTDRYTLRRGGPGEENVASFATKLWWYRRQAPDRNGRRDEDS